MNPLRSAKAAHYRLIVALGRCAASLVVAALLAPAACGTKTETKPSTCTPGQSIACTGTGACAGYQVCKSDGSGYADCICGDGSGRTFPPAGAYSGHLGAACTVKDDCRTGFECIASGSKLIHGEGPSAGMCLAKCLVDHDFCVDFDATSKCFVLDDGGTADAADDVAYCLPGCKLGMHPDDKDKCRSRVDLVCSEAVAGSGVGYCRPACGRDLDCAPRTCDIATGLCGDSAPSGDPIGSSCDATSSKCAGGCIAHGRSYSECSGVCSFGTPGCGQSRLDPPLDYYCAEDPTTGSGKGDLGYCSRLCVCDRDCGRPDAVCEPRPDLMAKTGRAGVCGSKTLSSGAARKSTPCAP